VKASSENSAEANLKIEEDIQSFDRLNKRKLITSLKMCVYEPIFANKVPKMVNHELKSSSGFSIVTSMFKNTIFGFSEEQADQLLRVDEAELELSNGDVILAKPGTLVKKCWRVKNLGTRVWPKDTRIVSVTDYFYFDAPKLESFLRPGEVMDIAIKLYVPEDEPSEDNIKEYICRLF